MITLIILSLFYTGLMSQQAWEMMRDEDGIRIFIRDVADSDFKEFRGEITIICEAMQNILEAITDVGEYEKLFPDCYNPKTIRRIGDSLTVNYLITKTPWPFRDRDGIYEQTLRISSPDSVATISIKAIPDYLPKVDPYVRIQYGIGFWEIHKIALNRYLVVYQFHADPKEKVPWWIAKQFIVENPFITLRTLRSIIQDNI